MLESALMMRLFFTGFGYIAKETTSSSMLSVPIALMSYLFHGAVALYNYTYSAGTLIIMSSGVYLNMLLHVGGTGARHLTRDKFEHSLKA